MNACLPLSGARDFDFLHGKWRVRHRTLRERLAGSTQWEEAIGVDIVRPAFAGFGNIGRFVRLVDDRLFEGAPIRLFDPRIDRWRIYWLDTADQRMEPPVIGGFADGVAEFLGDDMLRGRPIKVRFRWTDVTPAHARWEQSFSSDNGKTWELNSIMEFDRDERVPDEPTIDYLQGLQP
ncbi:DUF1579 domain-containing protein [Erythrobacter sp. JK5]|uniref:DUF1579 domain-containing protein n=1 Tax=Erythrobacter sp. JK5 TaxID=2829500 RepID=UPI001BA9189A|nr:DUF1579 domain-containing protein [Erythrobacter sp. JK5]QUL37631.1 DUF1579 domain-containing protein [Erythrobacter sp. JK5]